MKFTPKVSLTEAMAANPLEVAVTEDHDITSKAQEGLLTAIAAETDAINQYSQIKTMVDMSEPWLKAAVGETLDDIIHEERKHLAQLSKVTSELPIMKEAWEEGWKEAETGKDVKESVEDILNEDNISRAFYPSVVSEIIVRHIKDSYPELGDTQLADIEILLDRQFEPYTFTNKLNAPEKKLIDAQDIDFALDKLAGLTVGNLYEPDYDEETDQFIPNPAQEDTRPLLVDREELEIQIIDSQNPKTTAGNKFSDVQKEVLSEIDNKIDEETYSSYPDKYKLYILNSIKNYVDNLILPENWIDADPD